MALKDFQAANEPSLADFALRFCLSKDRLDELNRGCEELLRGQIFITPAE